MRVFEELKKNPMVIMSDAFDLLTQLYVAQNGLNYPETLNESINRTYKHIRSIMLSDESVTRKYYGVEYDQKGEEYIVEASEEYIKIRGYSPKHSLVNILELLASYNNDLIANGKQPLSELKSQVSNQDNNNNVNVCEIAESITRIVMNVVNREGNIKVETFVSIFNEMTQDIKNDSIRLQLPKLKDLLRNLLDDKIAKGRISEVTEKKILAGIHLADKYKEGDKLPQSSAPLIEDLKGFNLAKSDRQHVADIFFKYRKE